MKQPDLRVVDSNFVAPTPAVQVNTFVVVETKSVQLIFHNGRMLTTLQAGEAMRDIFKRGTEMVALAMSSPDGKGSTFK